MTNDRRDIQVGRDYREIHVSDRGIYVEGDFIQTSGPRLVSVTGLNTIPPSIADREWIDRTQPQHQLLEGIAASQAFLEIVGKSGFGKSWLAAWVYQQVRSQFDRALWVNFRKIPSFNQFACWVLQEIDRPLDAQIAERIEDEELANQLVFRLLDQHRVLVVMDQLEAILDAADWGAFAAFLERWQQEGRQSTVLVTTRQSLLDPVIGERYRLNLVGLELAEGEALLLLHQLEPANGSELRHLVEIAAGHPLLLNLAASWLKQEGKTTVDEIALGFFQRLFANYQGDPEAQVEEIFTVLFDALAAPLQTLLLGVSVYRDPFDLDMAQAMLPEARKADLEDLSRQAFLLEQENRWTLHPLMHYSVQKVMQQQGETSAAHEKAIAYFQAHLKPSGSSLADFAEYLELFHHHCELQQYEQAYRVLDGCFAFLKHLGYYQDLAQMYKRLTSAWGKESPTILSEQTNLGRAWGFLGGTYVSLGQFQEALAAYQHSQQWFQQLGDDRGNAFSLEGLGDTYYSLGQYQQAIDLYEQALEIGCEIGNWQGGSSVLTGLGNAYRRLGQYSQAINFQEQSLSIKRKIGDRQGEAVALSGLGNTYRIMGRYQQAIDLHEQALSIVREIGSRQGESASLGSLGMVYGFLGQYQQAIDLYEQALAIDREIGNRQGEAASLGNLGNAYYALEQHADAIDLYEQQLTIVCAIGDHQGESNALSGLGGAYDALGQYEQAIELHEQALAIDREIGNPYGEARCLFNKALVLARYAPRRLEALETFKQSRTISAELGLGHRVKQCDKAIHYFSQIVATEDPHAPRIAPEIGPPHRTAEESAPPPISDSVSPQPSGSSHREIPQWQQMLWLFGISLAVIVIAKLLLDS